VSVCSDVTNSRLETAIITTFRMFAREAANGYGDAAGFRWCGCCSREAEF